MGPEGIILVNPPITTFQQSLIYSALSLIETLYAAFSPLFYLFGSQAGYVGW